MVKSIVAFYESQEKNGHNFRFFINLRRKLSSENFCRKRQRLFTRPGEQQGHGGKGGWHPTAIDAKLDRAPINSLEQPEKCLVQAVGVQAVFLDVRVLMRHSRFLSGEVVGQALLVVKHDLSHKPQLHQDFFCKSTKRVNGVACHPSTWSMPWANTSAVTAPSTTRPI